MMIQIKISLVPYNKKNKIDLKDTKEMLYQPICLLVVGSPSFWNAPNST